jgi:hypothetical protein
MFAAATGTAPRRVTPRFRSVLATLLVVELMAAAAVSWTPVSALTSAIAFRSAVVDPPATVPLPPGTTRTITLRFRNTGLRSWERGNPGTQVDLAVGDDRAEFAALNVAVNWLSANRIATTKEATVPPGAVGTFIFDVRAPVKLGMYRLPLRLVVDGVTWLDDEGVVLVLVSDYGFHTELIDQTAPPTLRAGETSGPLTVRLANTGSRPWVRGVPEQQVNHGVEGDDGSARSFVAGWPTADRVAIQNEATVAAGAIGTFTFRVRAPATPGTYTLRLRPVVDGVTWMDASLMSVVTVLPAAGVSSATVDRSAPHPTFTLSAAVDPGSAAAGTAVNITANVASDIAANATIGVEIRAESGATLAYQQWFPDQSFSPDQPRSFAVSWRISASSTTGTYVVRLRAFSADLKALYASNESAVITVTARITAVAAASASPSPTLPIAAPTFPGATGTAAPTASSTNPTAAPTSSAPPTPSFTSTASVAPASVTAGAGVSINATVTSATSTNALVSISVYPPAGAVAVMQQWFDNQTFSAGQSRSYPLAWQTSTTEAAGTYRVSLGVFSPGWALQYSWTDSAATFAVAAPATPSPTPTPAPSATPTPSSPATPTATPAVSSTPMPQPTPANNVLVNAGFENSSTAWTMDPRASIDTTAGNARSGSSSLKLVATAPWQGTGQAVLVTPGQTYNISAWARSATAGAYLTLISLDANGAELGAHIDLVFPASAAWTQRSATYVPANGTVRVWVGLQSSASGTFWFDDVSLTPSGVVPTLTPTPTPTPAPTAAGTGTPAPTPTPAPTATSAPTATPAPPVTGLPALHVQGNHIVNAQGQIVRLHGVNRAGTEYACIQGWGIFDGPNDQTSIQAMKSWNVNAVRVPLNEDCWLAINGSPAAFSGATYQSAIRSYVNLLIQNGVYPIVELHWTAPGTQQSTGLQPMLNMDHSVTFWSQVAAAFSGNDRVILEPHNEPYPDGNSDSTAGWVCWRDGGSCPGVGYQAAGMQAIVNAIRGAGASNIIALGGLQYSNALSQWLTYKPADPRNNLAAAWHVYNINACSNVACYDLRAGAVAAQVPIIATEIGNDSCNAAFLNALMSWLDARQQGYLAWTWDTWGSACGNMALISSYSGTATAYGQAIKDHFALVP